ncbi:PAS domain-containing sensor histidine kinase [Sporosarcina sp. P12(2017)]|uniref:two-component system histidine kinase PnpS n=1 Tax=unclassified Sporosarcina TaxID=2647733 RepID=UPI000C16508E|nr:MULTISPECIES: ATP-binding protein [unclassified Sporosarcina]PIC58580.1 PAS domain-containing sensor histidine kinase [Sporosarcina sp. P10]PIC61899.1 PAS domain-containing sensor histidine kinase [Sporosarcina sp. P12(2017)]
MKYYYTKILTVSAVILSILLIVLGIILGQFFHLFGKNVDATIQQTYWVYLLFTLVLVFVVMMFVMTKILQQYVQPFDHFTGVVHQLARGNYLVRAHNEDSKINHQLTNSINQVAQKLQGNSALRAMEQERLNTLVSSIGSSLLMFGRQGAVNLVNRVFEETFQRNGEELMGKTFKDIGLPSDIEKEIETIFLTEEVRTFQSQVVLTEGVCHLDVYGAPVIGENGNWLGIVIIMHDITELVHLEQIRKDFVANVSHELKTPVTSIKGFSEMLLDGAVEDPVIRRDFLEIMYKESNRLQLLIEDLLRLSSMERGSFEITRKPVDVMEVVEQSIKIVQKKVQEKEMRIDLHMPEQLIILADHDRLVQVMVNLLNNAIAYSQEKTIVTVSVEEIDEYVEISVRDQGIGIMPSELPRLFERFYRVDRARSRESGGTGLGLAIVKHIAEAHHGTVTVDSEVGVGTVFRIQLPTHEQL